MSLLPKISIIVPVYNTEKYIYKCVESILNQSYKNYEIILVDDSSPDNCPEICDELAEEYDIIKVVHKKNTGLGLTRNAGLQVASGDYVTFLDSDDWIESDHLSKFVEALDEETDMVIGTYKTCTDEGNIIKIFTNKCERQISNRKEICEIALSMIAPDKSVKSELSLSMSVCFNLYRLCYIKENDIRFTSEKICVGEDLFFNLNYLKYCSKVKTIDSPSYNYRCNIDSITRKFDNKRFERTIAFYDKLMNSEFEYIKGEEFVFRAKRGTLSKMRVAFKLLAGSSISFGEKYKKTKEYIRDSRFRNIIDGFPIEIYRPSIRFTTVLVKMRFTLLILLIFSFKSRSESRR